MLQNKKENVKNICIFVTTLEREAFMKKREHTQILVQLYEIQRRLDNINKVQDMDTRSFNKFANDITSRMKDNTALLNLVAANITNNLVNMDATLNKFAKTMTDKDFWDKIQNPPKEERKSLFGQTPLEFAKKTSSQADVDEDTEPYKIPLSGQELFDQFNENIKKRNLKHRIDELTVNHEKVVCGLDSKYRSPDILFLCNRKACGKKCAYPECKHTQSYNYAVHACSTMIFETHINPQTGEPFLEEVQRKEEIELQKIIDRVNEVTKEMSKEPQKGTTRLYSDDASFAAACAALSSMPIKTQLIKEAQEVEKKELEYQQLVKYTDEYFQLRDHSKNTSFLPLRNEIEREKNSLLSCLTEGIDEPQRSIICNMISELDKKK